MTEADEHETLALSHFVNKFMQGIKDENKFKRRSALDTMLKELLASFTASASAPTTSALRFNADTAKFVVRSTLVMCSDPIEKCRELALAIVSAVLEHSASKSSSSSSAGLENEAFWHTDLTGLVITCMHERLAGHDVKETSEEIRLSMLKLLERLVATKAASDQHRFSFEIHFQELVAVLVNALNDNFSEVKKSACECVRSLAVHLAASCFHMQSEQLVRALLVNATHQHSRVRKDVVDCLRVCVLHGQSKSVTDALPHLAQRLFDQATVVRLAVVKLIGSWLLDLVDRYSFFHKLIPLLLSGFIDEALEVQETAESLWWDVGVKYERENDEELKDKANFVDSADVMNNYPIEFKDRRPNLGCRELIRQNASKILPGILNDIGDWVEATRVKSMQLLYVMIWQAECNVTQHLETVLQTLFKASGEKNDIIQAHLAKCATLIGHFTKCDLALPMCFKAIRRMNAPNPGSIAILNGLMCGHGASRIAATSSSLSLLIDTARFVNEICLTCDSQLQAKVLECCETLLPLVRTDSSDTTDESTRTQFEFLMFRSLFTILALANSNDTHLIAKINAAIECMDATLSRKHAHMSKFLQELETDCSMWNDNSLEPFIFVRLLHECGLSEQVFGQVLNILKTALEPSKDVQLRSRLLLLLPDIFVSSKCMSIEASLVYLRLCFEDIVAHMILPNAVWRAGRTASAVRLSAVTSLALLLQCEALRQSVVELRATTLAELVKTVLSTLDDDNKTTRLYSAKLFSLLLSTSCGGGSTARLHLDRDQLHKLYPEFIKRLDDQSDDIRAEMLNVFDVYLACLTTTADGTTYDPVLYQAHLRTINENLLLYLDDPALDIQQRVLRILQSSARLGTDILLDQCTKAKSKQRNAHYCTELIQYCRDLQQQQQTQDK